MEEILDQLRLVVYLNLYIPNGAEFLPSTVCLGISKVGIWNHPFPLEPLTNSEQGPPPMRMTCATKVEAIWNGQNQEQKTGVVEMLLCIKTSTFTVHLILWYPLSQ